MWNQCIPPLKRGTNGPRHFCTETSGRTRTTWSVSPWWQIRGIIAKSLKILGWWFMKSFGQIILIHFRAISLSPDVMGYCILCIWFCFGLLYCELSSKKIPSILHSELLNSHTTFTQLVPEFYDWKANFILCFFLARRQIGYTVVAMSMTNPSFWCEQKSHRMIDMSKSSFFPS